MTTLKYDTVEYNVVYIDPTIASAGDGSTPALALADLPTTIVNKTCYVMRRTNAEYHVSMKRQFDTGLTHVILLGMPKAGKSKFYALLDQEVKDAWGSDDSYSDRKYSNVTMDNTYANYTSNVNGTVFRQGNMQRFVADHCYFYRTSVSMKNEDQYINYMFSFPDGGWNTSIEFLNCKFGYTQFDLEDNDFLTTNTTISETNRSHFKCQAYVYMYTGNDVVFDNCIMNSVTVPTTAYNTEYSEAYGNCKSLMFRYCPKNLKILNMECNYLHHKDFYWYSSGSRWDYYINNSPILIYYDGNSESSYRNDKCSVYVENFVGNHIREGEGGYYNRRFFDIRTSNLYLKNIKFNFKNMKNAVYNARSGTDYCLRINKVQHELQVDGIYFNKDNQSLKIACFPLFGLYNYIPGSPGNGGHNFIKNIKFEFYEDSDFDEDTGDACYLLSSEYSYDSSNQFMESLTQYTRNTTGNFSTAMIVKNIDIKAPISGSYGLSLNKFSVKTKDLGCRIYMFCSSLEADKIYNYRPDIWGIHCNRGCYLNCKEYETKLDGTYSYNGINHIRTFTDWNNGGSYYSHLEDPQNSSSIYVGKSNVLLFTTDYMSTAKAITAASQKTMWVCPNYIRDNQFFARSANTFCKSWNVGRRVSSEVVHNTSLKFYNNIYNLGMHPIPAVIGLYPDHGFEIVPSSAGNYNIVAYTAAKNFVASELPRISSQYMLDVAVPDSYDEETGDITYKHYYSQGLFDDDSTWTNETSEGLNTYKFIVPIIIDEIISDKSGNVIPVDVKVSYNMYSAEGCCYLDPNIEMVAAV